MVANAFGEVLGQYTVYERLGRGGMATVNRAEMRGFAGFRKPVALKRLHPQVAKDPSMLESFVHEARLASHLHHPNIAQTYDLGRVGDSYFIAMEYVPGPTLAQLLRRTAAAAVSIPIPIALAILSQLCDALDYAHNFCDDKGRPLGIIHRDVSPSNIMISSTGVVKLIDFGIAKAAGFGTAEAGLIKGKLSYMAPEYASGGQLDLRADLFGLGVIAHELLTGRSLFHAETDSDTLLLLRALPIEPPSRWNPDVPADLDDIVLTALQRTPELRWQSAAAMRTAIRNVLEAFGPQVTNQQLIEWVEWAIEQRLPKAAPRPARGARGIDALGGLPRLAAGSGIDLARELEGIPELSSEPHEPSAGAEAPTRPVGKKVSRPAAPGGRRAWLLLLLLLALGVAAQEQLAATGRQLYAWCVG